ncbi:hypothetical protein JCM24511_00611 [Saitozyma sp. JCM 24511]|nr:hypothetical protein JCM24511_00611 [Saitozyma sp. JCM 24511]
MSEDERTTYKVITLKGSDNYEDWKLSIFASKATTDPADKRKAGKCFALIIQSLSPVITSSLPADCSDPLDPKAALLWAHLRRTFSVQVGARQATLGNRPQQFNNQRSNSGPKKDWPRDDNAFCEYHGVKGHSTESCFTRKRADANEANNKPHAKVAQAEDIPTAQVAKLDVNHDSDGSAYISAAVPNNFNSVPAIKTVPGIFIIDSGASQHMVTSSALLSDVKQITPVSVKIGDGTKLLSRSSGSLILGIPTSLLSPVYRQTFSRSRRPPPRSFGASLATRQPCTTPMRRRSALRTFKADSTPSKRVRLPPLRLQSLTDSQYFEIGTTVWAT